MFNSTNFAPKLLVLNMKKLPFLFVFSVLLLLFIGCHRVDRSALLCSADSLVDNYRTDSALQLLKQIDRPGDLSEADLMFYAWIEGKAHLYYRISMTEDTLLCRAIDYFQQQKDSSKELMGIHLKGNYFMWQKQYDKAFKIWDAGLALASARRDSLAVINFLWDKAKLYYIEQRDYAQAARCMKLALDYIPEDQLVNRHSTCYSLALNLGLIGDSSYHYYYKQSIALAEQNKDTLRWCHYMRNYASAISREGLWEEANAWIKRVWEVSPKYYGYPITQLILVENYLKMHQIDSARYYLNMAWKNSAALEKKGEGDMGIRNMLYSVQMLIDFSQGSDFSTVGQGRYNDSILNVERDKNSSMRQQMETKMNLERQNYQLTIDRQRNQLVFLVGTFVLLIGGIALFFYIRSRRVRLAEAEDRIETLNRLLVDASQNNATEKGSGFFKKIMLQQLGIIRLVANAPTSQNQELLRRISGITNNEVPVESLLVWEDLYPLIDSIYEGFYTHMQKHFGEMLTDKEQQLCCLLCAGFSTKEISVVTQQSIPTIYMRKTGIRKKLNMDEKQDIIAYLKGI